MKSNRRQFLKGIGGFSLALPYMPSLLSREARAALASASPGIYIQMVSCNAVDDTAWFPQVAANQFTELSEHAKRMSLSGLTGSGASKIFGKEYADQYKHYTLIRNLGIYGPKPNHQSGSLCMGSYRGVSTEMDANWIHNPTIDKVLENSSKFYGNENPVIKNLSVSTGQTHGASYGFDGVQAPCYTNPAVVFDLLFGTQTASSNSQVNVLNSVMQDYTRTKNDSRISFVDKLLLEERMDMFADLQTALNSVSSGNQCTVPTRPQAFTDLSFGSGIVNATAHVDAMMKVSVAAVKCGLTRILVWNEMCPMGLNGNEAHGSSHGGDPNWNAQVEYQQWIHKNIFSRFVKELDVQDGTGKTYLDRTGLIHMLENGGNGIYHDLNNAYVICAGKMNGYLDPGNFYDYGYTRKIPSGYGDFGTMHLPMNCLWNTILQGNGLTTSDYKTAGQDGAGFGYSDDKWTSGYYKEMCEFSALHAGQLLPFMKKAG